MDGNFGGFHKVAFSSISRTNWNIFGKLKVGGRKTGVPGENTSEQCLSQEP